MQWQSNPARCEYVLGNLVLGPFGAHGEKSFPLDEAAEWNGHNNQPAKSLLTRQAWQLMKVLPIALAPECSYAQARPKTP